MSGPAYGRPDLKPQPQRRVADRLKFLIAPPAVLQTRLSKTAKIMTLIVARHTRGWDKPNQVMTREWATIPRHAFEHATNVSRQMLRKARNEARRAGAIDFRRGSGNNWEYKLLIDYTPQEATEVRKCNTCRETSRMPLAQNLVYIPPLYFLKFGKYATDAQFSVVGVIIAATMRVRPGKQGELFAGQHAAIDISEISALSGVSGRQVIRVIAWAVKHAGVSRELRAGRPSTYWIEPDKFVAALKILDERAPRTITPRDERENEFDPEPERAARNQSVTPDMELPPPFPKNFALCLNCGTFGAHKRVPLEVAARFEQATAARAGPGPPEPAKPASKSRAGRERTPDVLFDEAWNLCLRSRRPLSPTDRIKARELWRKHAGKEQMILAYIRDQFAMKKPEWVSSLRTILSEDQWNRVIESPSDTPPFASKHVSAEDLYDYAVTRRISTDRAREILTGQGYECE